MERCNIILRTLSAGVLALTLVLIPLSQAEAIQCAAGTSYCDWNAECDSFYIYPFTIKKYEKVTVNDGDPHPSCFSINRVCSSDCIKRFYNP